MSWIKSVSQITDGEVIAIDGKTLKHSYDKGAEKGAIHMVSAWATANRLVLGQRQVDQKSNEIEVNASREVPSREHCVDFTAIPELIKILDIAGCIVTIDARGCQKDIVKLISQKQGDYIITLKKNQGNLYKNVEQLFRKAIATGFEGFNQSDYHTREELHGREEIRHYLMLSNIAEKIDPDQKWANLKSIGMVESVRIVNGKTTIESRYYISSLIGNAKLLGQSVRSHWGVENSLHWSLQYCSDLMLPSMKMTVE